MARYKLMPEAEKDLREIREYITRRDSARAAARVLKRIEGKLQDLAANPGYGHRREDLTERDVLFSRVYSYLIIYRPGTRPLEIVGVPSGYENVAEMLREAGRKPEISESSTAKEPEKKPKQTLEHDDDLEL